MTFDDYELAAGEFRKEAYDDVAAVMGLTSEAGEVAGKFMKARRDFEFSTTAVALELGDVLWNLSAIASDIGFSLSQIAQMNLNKLDSRQKRGTIHGSGDYR